MLLWKVTHIICDITFAVLELVLFTCCVYKLHKILLLRYESANAIRIEYFIWNIEWGSALGRQSCDTGRRFQPPNVEHDTRNNDYGSPHCRLIHNTNTNEEPYDTNNEDRGRNIQMSESGWNVEGEELSDNAKTSWKLIYLCKWVNIFSNVTSPTLLRFNFGLVLRKSSSTNLVLINSFFSKVYKSLYWC